MIQTRNDSPRFRLFLICALFAFCGGIQPGKALLYATDIGCYEHGYSSPSPANTIREDFDDKLYGGTGETYYVDRNGSDGEGDGSRKSPWKTLAFASERVIKPGDVIHLNQGTHEIESRVFLQPGISLEGDRNESGESPSIITSRHLTDEWNAAIINLVSAPKSNTDGNQHIAWLTFDGSIGRKKGRSSAAQAIEIANRNNVAVHDCAILDFQWVGVGWRAADVLMGASYNPDRSGQPKYYVTGGRFYNNTITDCAFYGASENDNGYPWGRGALLCGGLKNFRIYNNSLIERCTSERLQGVPIKFWYYAGWMLGCKIHDNKIMRTGSTVNSTDAAGWAFALESMYHSGLEIMNNTIIGAIDLNNGYCGEFDGTKYDYATWIHHNHFITDPEKPDGFDQFAVVLEAETYKTVIEQNRIDHYGAAVYFNIRAGVSDFIFRYNLCTGLRGEGAASAAAIRMDGSNGVDTDRNGDGQNDAVTIEINDMRIYNNLFAAERGGFGVILGQGINPWNGKKILIANNIFYGFDYNWLTLNHFLTLDKILIENNIYAGCGGWNGADNGSPQGAISASGKMTNLVQKNNLGLSDADFSRLFVSPSDYHLAVGSPAIDRGKNLGPQFDLDRNPVPFSK